MTINLATLMGSSPPKCVIKDDFMDGDISDVEWAVESRGRQVGTTLREQREENDSWISAQCLGTQSARTRHVMSTSNPNPSPGRSQAQIAQRTQLRHTAAQTIDVLAHLSETSDYFSSATSKAHRYTSANLPHLNKAACPRFAHPRPVRIRVVNEDTIDAALGLANCSRYLSTIDDRKPVCILNMANATRMGGGFKNGALAQEEALCYRSSLFFTLKKRFYPLQDDTKSSDPDAAIVYSPKVFVIRESMHKGHALLDTSKPDSLPVVSAVSAAALRLPPLKKTQVLSVQPSSSSSSPSTSASASASTSTSTSKTLTTVVRELYARPRDRDIMKEKLRMILRSAAYNEHRRLVLSAFGCGCFANPAPEIADCWAEVFREPEFRGGWWESIVFAVLDDQVGEGEIGDGNFGIFYRRLNGMAVS